VYELTDPAEEKIRNSRRTIYGAKDVAFTAQAERDLKARARSRIRRSADLHGEDAALAQRRSGGARRPRDFVITVREVRLSAGAGFSFAHRRHDDHARPPKVPAARGVKLMPNGKIKGLMPERLRLGIDRHGDARVREKQGFAYRCSVRRRQIGGAELSEEEAGRLLNEVVDLGVTSFDTAPSYACPKERIGATPRGTARTRSSSAPKAATAWRAPGLDRGGDHARRGIKPSRACEPDRIVVFHLHSCPREVLARGEVVHALERAREAGKFQVAAYSGENDALAWAIDSDGFGSVQTSVGLCDQAARPRDPSAKPAASA